jgi:hypothetical protein
MSEATSQFQHPASGQPQQPDRAYSVEEAKELLNIGTTLFYAERNAKRLRVCKIGERSVVFASDLAAYQALLKSEADARPVKSPQAA